MKSFLADALRWIFPLAARGATVDFFGTDALGFLTEDFEDEAFVELPFGFDDVLFVDRFVEDLDEEARSFCTSVPIGSNRRATTRMKQGRARIQNSFPRTDALIISGDAGVALEG